LDQNEWAQVEERATRTLDWVGYHPGMVTVALDNLSLGCARLLAVKEARTGNVAQAAEFLRRAVDGLRDVGQMLYLPHGLLARAPLYRFTCNYERAERDLAEVHRIAHRSGMGLHLADYHLESARLRLAQGDHDKAREHLATAREMIEHMGYHRRDNEVNELA